MLYLSFLLIVGCMDKTDERGFYIEGKKLDIIKIQKLYMIRKGMIGLVMTCLIGIKKGLISTRE